MRTHQQPKNSIFTLLDRFLARKTVFGFASELKTFEELPAIFRDVLSEVLSVDERIERMILIPSLGIIREGQNPKLQKWQILPWQIHPEKVIVLSSERLFVLSHVQPDLRPDVISISTSDLLFLETGNILLHSWFGWEWVNHTHVDQGRVYYNSVGRYLFDTLAAQLRLAVYEANWGNFPNLDPRYERLDGLPFKFKNMIRLHMLLPGEQIQGVVFREQIKRMWKRGNGPGFLSNLAVIRTNAHIIITQEDPTFEEEGPGLITQYLPIHLIHDVRINEQNIYLEWGIHLRSGDVGSTIKTMFPTVQTQDVHNLVERWL